MPLAPKRKGMTTSDRIVATVIAIVSILMVVGFEAVMPSHAGRVGTSISDSRGEPFP